ncbi:hypothetical protein [Sporomusa sp.]|uniref:hypothetical protein n=1 Tax=Sporomusa sp. TaxID=2078658 RepID=UPI002B9B9BE5|nr:hypothetical protein [Sporomusa sp.]HWR41834.1 hypothetical protein [Sporomusa sp.]
MEYKHIEQSRIPACTLDEQLFRKLWDIFNQDGEFLWHAAVGTGDDLLGKKEERSTQNVQSLEELIGFAKKLPHIDQISLTVEVPDKGTMALALQNFVPISGKLIVSGQEEAWVNERFDACLALFTERKKDFNTLIYTRLGFGIIQTAIPLSSMFIFVMLAAGLLIPSEIRHSQWLWWITAATVVITLRLAYTVSDKLILYCMEKYPYIKWQER